VRVVTVDIETFWSATHTLKKMSPIAYAMHPDTELISLALKIDAGETEVRFGESAVRELLATVDWANALVIGHNMSVFDALILRWRLGVNPRMWGCTLAMARPVLGNTLKSLSLGSLVEYYGIGVKDAGVLHATMGKRLNDFDLRELAQMAVYNKADADQCYALFQRLKPYFSAEELWHIDANIRMFVDPVFEVDTAMMNDALTQEIHDKNEALRLVATHLGAATVDDAKKQLMSAAKFSAVLRSRNVEVPLKRSKTDPRKKIPAIAKTDAAMQALLEHDDQVVAAAARARLAVKSTQLETRLQLLLATYNILGKLPVPAHYCGAATGRDSGFLYNMLNMPRVNRKRPRNSDALRDGIVAPEGYEIVAADLSGIELRVNHTLWQVRRSMALWSADPEADLYIPTAAGYYGVPESEIAKDDPRRQMGKVLELSCGFGIGHVKLRDQARAQFGLNLTLQDSKRGVDSWRGRYPEITDKRTGGWRRCEEALTFIAAGERFDIDPWGLCRTEKDAIVLPSGRRIRYPDLRQEWVKRYSEVDGELVEEDRLSWVYGHGQDKAYLYGGKVDENIVQALARDVIFPCALEIFKRTGRRPAHKVYDELVYVVPKAEAGPHLALVHAVLRKSPTWWPALVTWSEGGTGTRYGEAK
jgi:hypothetical protein